jgi:hypothetical protein
MILLRCVNNLSARPGMLRCCLVCLLVLLVAGPAQAASWAEAMFDELSVDFGSVPRGTTLTHRFRLVNNSNGVVIITGVRVSCGCTAASTLKDALRPGEETAIVAQMDTSRFSGVRAVTVYVQFDHPAWEEVSLRVQANSREDIRITPDVLAFGRTRRGASPSTAVTVTFSGNARSQVVEVLSDTNYVQAAAKEMERQDGEVNYRLTATLRPDTPAGTWYTDVWLKTNNATVPRVRVPLTVEIEPALTVSPAVAAFGSVKSGAEAERKVIVRGARPFKITEVRGTDAGLVVRDTTTESKPVHVLTVTLKAGEPGDLNRALGVITDLKEEAEIEFRAKAEIVP